MMPLHIFSLSISKRMLALAAVCTAALFLGTLFVFQAHAQSFALLNGGAATSVSPGKAYLSPQAAAAAASAAGSAEAPMLEAHIANNGSALLRGARVVSVSGSVIHVAMQWGAADFSWAIQTNSNTKFIAASAEMETLADIQAGDIVTITGMLTGSGTEPTIDAQFVRE